MEVYGVSKGESPHIFLDDGGPFGHGVYEDGTCTLSNGANELLSDSILPMGPDCTKSEVLLTLCACLSKQLS